MKKSCLLFILFLIALTVAYSLFLRRFIPSDGVWFLGFFGSLSLLLLAGALRTSWDTFKKVGAIRDALNGRPFEEGKIIAAVGSIRADGDPLLSPIQQKPCVAYETELYHRSSRPSSESSQAHSYVYVGVGMTPCRIATMQGEVRLLGFPLLEEFPQKKLHNFSFRQNLLAYLKTAPLQPMQGVKKLQLFTKMENVMTDEDGALRQDWQLGPIPELETPEGEKGSVSQARPIREEAEEEEIEGEETDEEEAEALEGPFQGYQLGERTVAPEDSVVAFGIYSASDLGIRGRFQFGGRPNELYPGTASSISKKIRGNARATLIFSIVFFSFFHGMMTFLILHAPKP
ncbi:MAG: hypothetical protein U1F57_08180 [bacterium]